MLVKNRQIVWRVGVPYFFALVFLVFLFTGITRCHADEEWKEISDPKNIFWNGYIQVVGESDPGQRPSMAKRLAQMDAYRRLLEILKEIRINSSTTISMGTVTEDVINAKLEGVVRQSSICGFEFNKTDKSGKLCMRLYLKGEEDRFIKDLYELVKSRQ